MKKYRLLTVLTVLVLMMGGFSTVKADIIPPQGEGMIGLQAVVLCETLTVRQQPSASSKAVMTLHYGNTILIQPETGGWAACFLSDSEETGRAGWVNEDYLAIDPAWYLTEKSTPVYAWNDTMAPKVALLNKGVKLPILKDEGAWLIVSLRGATGWIYQPDFYTEISATGRQDGERFETAIMIEGMDETVRYEHVRNMNLGIEIDYDYESFRRSSAFDCEYFISVYDNPEKPLNYLEVRHYDENAETVFAAVVETLSKEYEITQSAHNLEHAGNCVMIDASVVKGTDLMADILQTVYT